MDCKEILLGFDQVGEIINIFSTHKIYTCNIDTGSPTYTDRYFLDCHGYAPHLFDLINIDKLDLYFEVFGRYPPGNGIWPWCDSREDVITLLEALIESSKTNTKYEEI